MRKEALLKLKEELAQAREEINYLQDIINQAIHKLMEGK
jgi:hypothetical protein